MSTQFDRRMEIASSIADWLAENGQTFRAQQVRGIRASLAQFRAIARDNAALRRCLTPIAQARVTESRRALAEELHTTAAQLERMAKIADMGGAGSDIGVEVPDAAYLAALLRRAAS